MLCCPVSPTDDALKTFAGGYSMLALIIQVCLRPIQTTSLTVRKILMSVTLHHRQLLHQGRVFNFTREQITLENGSTVNLDMVRHPGAAAMVPLLNASTVILLKQYRYAAGGHIWEIPAGTLNVDESPLACARRELVEETGWSAASWHKLTEITPVPGYSDERIHLFLATDLQLDVQNLDQDEILAVHEIDFEQAMAMIASGDIQDAKTLCGLFMARSWLAANPLF